ncbi:hypothetical protein Tco_1255118 [Tanacetum coccineum]
MPNNAKTYDETGDLEDHVKKFQATQVERWAMPTWCHMFNSTLIGAARVWFAPESIDGYKDLKAAFLAYVMQQKKYVKDLVEIHNIKQRDGKTIEEFMERFKSGGLTFEVSQGKDGGLAGLPPYKNTQGNPRGRSKKVQIATTYGNPGGEEKQQQVLMTRQKVTQSFERVSEITFPSLTTVVEQRDKPFFSDHDRESTCESIAVTIDSLSRRIIALFTEEKGPGPGAFREAIPKRKWRMGVDLLELNKACLLGLVTPSRNHWKDKSLCKATTLIVSWMLTKAITRYRWQSQMKRKRLSTPAMGYIVIPKCPSASRTLRPPTAEWWTKLFAAKLVGLLESAVEGNVLGLTLFSPEGIKPCPDKTDAVLQLPRGTRLQATKAALVRATPAGSTQTEGGRNLIV